MGAQLAAHLANGGFEVSIFDLRSELAKAGRDRLRQIRPNPLFLTELTSQIRIDSLDNLASLSTADWIIEAVVESLDVKRPLLERVDAHRAPHAIVSTNTSGLSIGSLAQGRSDAFRRHWIGTHFFNPPRYMHLVELIPTAETAPDVVETLADMLDHRLGKGVVVARDTPAFIANRLGMHGIMQLLAVAAAGDYTIEEIDAITGPIIGRPKSATFRTADLAGVDIVAAVAADLSTRLPDPVDRQTFEVPPILREMLDRRLLGEKTGQGFYKRVTRPGAAESSILTLDLKSFEYRDARPPALPELDAARRIDDLDERLRRLFTGSHRTGALLRRTLGATLVYAARIAPEIAHSIDDIDRAMRWGFGWERGPFETMDAIGIPAVLDAVAVEPPSAMATLKAAERTHWRDDGLPVAQPGFLLLKQAKQRKSAIATNAAASLVDLGDDVLAIEFHSKMNTIGGDTVAMIREGLDRAAREFAAVVIGHEGEPFSAGALLTLLLVEAQDGNWDEIDAMVRAFQAMTMAIKGSPVPVVVAPAGLSLGGACEICLHADRVQAAAETYVGLVEVGVGLLPAGGGTKEMLLRAIAHANGGDVQPALRHAFETIGFGKVSTSAADARRLGYLRDVDGVSMNRDRLIADAKARALARTAEGYAPPPAQSAVPVGGADAYAMLALGVHLGHRAGRLSDHDVTIGHALARILTGGDLPHRATVTESYLLDLEREAFLSLCGEPKTLERIGYMLKKGKPLRN